MTSEVCRYLSVTSRLKGSVKNGGIYSSSSGMGIGLAEYGRSYTFGAFFISICPERISLFLLSMITVHSWKPFMSAQQGTWSMAAGIPAMRYASSWSWLEKTHSLVEMGIPTRLSFQ